MQPPSVTIRTTLRTGDIGWVVQQHGFIHAAECGFDPTFEAYVAGPLADFVREASGRSRIWIAEKDGQNVGCIAIVAASEEVAQLRWFLVVPAARNLGLGRRLLEESLSFCREQGYRSVILWTVQSLAAAARLYLAAGFKKVEEKPGRRWGVDVIEEKYEIVFS